MATIDYTDYAINDYAYLCDDLLHTTNYNYVIIYCQQIVERILKGVLLHTFPKDAEVRKLVETTHNISNLCDKAVRIHPSLEPLSRVAPFLTRYYISARYPSNDFNVVSYQTVCNACAVTTKVVNWFFEKADFKLVYLTYKRLLNVKDDKIKNYSGSPKDRQKFKDLLGIRDLPKPLTGSRFYDTDILDPDFNDD